MFDSVGFRVFEYFNKKDERFAVINTVNFLVLLQGSLLVPLFIVLNLLTTIELNNLSYNSRMKYYIGIPLYLLLTAINSYYFKNKLKGERLESLRKKYYKEKYFISIWFIFLAPIFFVFIVPIIFGAINGTIHFPFLEQ